MLESKLHPPANRTRQVPRGELVQRVGALGDVPNLAILAPAGYGKTTLMSQLEQAEGRRTAWLTLDESDSDPATLLMSLANSLAAAAMVDQSALESFSTRRSGTVLTHGINALWNSLDSEDSGVLFLDQIDHIGTQSARDIIGSIMTRRPENMQLVIASRSGDGLPLPLLRSREAIAELTTEDLAMTSDEAAAVFQSVGIDAGVDLDEVMRQTEGWPVAVYLTALAIETGSFDPGGFEVRGDDVLFADYLKQELLASASEQTRSFLMRTSILEKLSGPLCDHVVGGEDSAEILTRLEKANLLVVPMDRTRVWYRYHSLLRDLLRSELERDHPGEVRSLHQSAADWLAGNGFPEQAVEHAMAAGDTSRFTDLVMSSARRVYASGRVETLAGWWSWMEGSGAVADLPELAALAGFFCALDGDAAGSELMAGYAFTDKNGEPIPDDDLGPLALLFRSLQAARGVDQALADSRAARAAFGEQSEWLHACLAAEAQATRATEDLQAAEPIRLEALLRSEALDARPSISHALAQRALAAIDRDDWEAAEEYVSRSLELIRQGGLEGYVTSAMAFILAARIEARRGDFDTARSQLAAAAALRPLLSVAAPLATLPMLHEMARAFVEVADVAGARRVMREAADIIAMRPRLGRLITDHEDLRQTISDLPAGTVGPSSLTRAELRVLPLLVTHLSFPEIGDRLHVSRHTVKAHAMSVYRKLNVSSRSEAVAKAREIGLISL